MKSSRSANWHLNEQMRIRKLRLRRVAKAVNQGAIAKASILQLKRSLSLQQRPQIRYTQHIQSTLAVWSRIRTCYLRGNLASADAVSGVAAKVKAAMNNPMQVVYARICENAVKKAAALNLLKHEQAHDSR